MLFHHNTFLDFNLLLQLQHPTGQLERGNRGDKGVTGHTGPRVWTRSWSLCYVLNKDMQPQLKPNILI